MAGRPLRRARRNSSDQESKKFYNLPGVRWFGDDPDENEEIALSELGVFAYLPIGVVGDWNDSRSRRTLPEGMHPGVTVVVLGIDMDNNFLVATANQEDIHLHLDGVGIPNLDDAMYYAKAVYRDRNTPSQSARMIDKRFQGLQRLHDPEIRAALRRS